MTYELTSATARLTTKAAVASALAIVAYVVLVGVLSPDEAAAAIDVVFDRNPEGVSGLGLGGTRVSGVGLGGTR